jgi:hypothetical protein
MVKVSHKIALVVLVEARLGAENPAQAALYALIKFIGWSLGTPVSGSVLAGITRLGYKRTNLEVFPG